MVTASPWVVVDDLQSIAYLHCLPDVRLASQTGCLPSMTGIRDNTGLKPFYRRNRRRCTSKPYIKGMKILNRFHYRSQFFVFLLLKFH